MIFKRAIRDAQPALALWAAGIAFAACCATASPAAENTETVAAPEVASPILITNAGEFWTIPERDKQRPLPVRMELVVYYYDPIWMLLYGQTGEQVSFFPVRGRPLPIKPGQKVRLEGTVVHAEGFDGDKVKATLLGEGPLPEPRPTAGRMEEVATLHGHWVQLEGYVLSQSEPDATHLQAELWSEGRRVGLTVLINGLDPVPQLTGARIRVRGVYDTLSDSTGALRKIEIWTATRDQLDVLGWMADDARFRVPRTPIDRLDALPRGAWTRVQGEVVAQEPGVSVVLRDESGQTEMANAQTEALPAGTMVEIIGRTAPGTMGGTLRETLFRRVEQAAAASGPRPARGAVPMRLRLAEQVRQLTPEEAAQRAPVILRGVVSWSDPRAERFYVQDVSGGVAVRRAGGDLPVHGTSVIVTGESAGGRLGPEVQATRVETSGALLLPPPRRISLDQALTGAEEGGWVEMQGWVRRVTEESGRVRLDLTAPTGEFVALLPPGTALERLDGAFVRLRGVCTAQVSLNGEVVGVELLLQGRESVVVEAPPPADPFAVGRESVAALRKLAPAQAAGRRVRLAGVMQLQLPGRHLFLQDETGGLFVLSRQPGVVAPGQWIEVVGLPGREGNRLVLREALWRPAAESGTVAPRVIDDAGWVEAAADATLVRVTGRLRQAAPEAGAYRLTLEAGDGTFDATVPTTEAWVPPAPGSRLELTGVYVVEHDEYRQPHAFELRLRSPADLRVTAAPPWWTLRRTLYATGVLVCCTLLVLGWVVALRRRVRRQMEQIRAQLDKESRLQAELERSSRLDSLGVLAGGIAHDFNNLLTAVLGNIGMIKFDDEAMKRVGAFVDDAERATRRAAEVTQQLLTFAKGGNPVRKAVNLPDIVQEAAGFARHGSNLGFEFDFAADLPPADADPGQISRVVHNLVINAVQAMPGGGKVRIAVAAELLPAGAVPGLRAGEYLKLTVSDNGPGIEPAALERIFEPYFTNKSRGSGLGLATTRSIVIKHGGQITVESARGQGTTFRVWLPAADKMAERLRSRPPFPRPAVRSRVLVMDDEGGVRRLAERFLAKAGHDVMVVEEGEAAVRAYCHARETGHPFDAVVLDLTVPGGMGGKDAAAAMLKVDPSVRLIASSGYSNDPVMSRHRDFGFSAVIPKPYDFEKFTRTIADVCGQPDGEPVSG